jgi:hypothetical protein
VTMSAANETSPGAIDSKEDTTSQGTGTRAAPVRRRDRHRQRAGFGTRRGQWRRHRRRRVPSR